MGAVCLEHAFFSIFRFHNLEPFCAEPRRQQGSVVRIIINYEDCRSILRRHEVLSSFETERRSGFYRRSRRLFHNSRSGHNRQWRKFDYCFAVRLRDSMRTTEVTELASARAAPQTTTQRN